MGKNAVLPGDHHMVVYIPEPTSDDMPGDVSRCWIVASYQRAMETLYEFIMGDDFLVDADARFEIFDEFLDPVGNQREIELMVAQRWEAEEGGPIHEADELSKRLDSIDAEEIETLFTPTATTTSTTTSTTPLSSPPPPPRKPEPIREVKFMDIKIEDHRK